MKKAFFMALTCLGLMACNGNGTISADQQSDSVEVASTPLVYEGFLPAASCYGIGTKLVITDEEHQLCSLSETYYNDENDPDITFTDEYTYQLVEKDGGKYYELNTSCDEPNIYFKIIDDSTIRMVNSELQEPEQIEGMSYDLKIVK